MGARFAELDWRNTRLGLLTLRRRRDPVLDVDVYEVKLDEEFLMSSLFTVAEEELARLGLAAVHGSDLDVVVGGLGLGYTARTVLDDRRVASLTVVEALPEVVEWHQKHLLPVSAALTDDRRTNLVAGDFFELVADGTGFDRAPGRSARPHDAILVDIDHSPRHVLHESHAPFYETAGLARLSQLLRSGGVFALWSDDPPDAEFEAVLRSVFARVEAHVVAFDNPFTGGTSSNTVYVAADRRSPPP